MNDPAAFDQLIEIVTAVRQLRARYNIQPKKRVPIIFKAASDWSLEAAVSQKEIIERLADCDLQIAHAIPSCAKQKG